MYLRHLVTGLAPQPVALVSIDCKRGVELSPFAARFSALATNPEQAAELLPVLIGHCGSLDHCRSPSLCRAA